MREAIADFVQRYVDQEYSVALNQAAPDDADFRSRIDELNSFFAPTLSVGVDRILEPGDPQYHRIGDLIRDRWPRKIFLIREYRHPEMGPLFRAYVSTDRKRGTSYYHCYYIALSSGVPQIVGRYFLYAAQSGWRWHAGARIDDPGTFLAIERFLPPSDPREIRDYEVDAGTIEAGACP